MNIDTTEMAGRLEAMLGRRIPDAKAIKVTNIEKISGGYSRIMSRFTAHIDGVEKQLISRADSPPGQALFDTDRVEEWEILSALTEDGRVPMPKALYFDADGSELGVKTIILECIEGEPFITRVRSATSGEDRIEQAGSLCDLMADIHQVPPNVLPSTIDHPADWNSYIDSLIDMWRQVGRDHIESDPFFTYMANWLDENRPETAPLCLVHGEFQMSNTVLNTDNQLLAVDWEFAHIGDPREDLGWCSWVGTMQPPDLIGQDTEAFLARYRERSGLGEDIINPVSLAYFSILPAIRVWQGFSKQQRAFVEGTNKNIGTVYSLAVLITAHEGWCKASGLGTGK